MSFRIHQRMSYVRPDVAWPQVLCCVISELLSAWLWGIVQRYQGCPSWLANSQTNTIVRTLVVSHLSTSRNSLLHEQNVRYHHQRIHRWILSCSRLFRSTISKFVSELHNIIIPSIWTGLSWLRTRRHGVPSILRSFITVLSVIMCYRGKLIKCKSLFL
jgi:hypothetical protein